MTVYVLSRPELNKSVILGVFSSRSMAEDMAEYHLFEHDEMCEIEAMVVKQPTCAGQEQERLLAFWRDRVRNDYVLRSAQAIAIRKGMSEEFEWMIALEIYAFMHDEFRKHLLRGPAPSAGGE